MKSISIVFIVFLATSVCAASMSIGTRIQGTLIDASTQAPISGATIAIPALRTGAVADVGGKFLILNIPPGHYLLTFSLIGYASITKTIDVQGDSLEVDRKSTRLNSSH